MSTKILGNEELNILRAKTPYSLPDNPSDKGFNARQIKTKFWEGYLLLFNWLKETQASLNNDFATTNSALLNESKRIDVILTYFSNGKANFAVRDRNNNIIDETYELKSEASTKFNQLIADIQSVQSASGNKIAGSQNINADGIQYTITLSNTQNATLSTITQYLPLATTLKAGLLSSSDKEKINNLESDLTNFLANAKAYTDEKLERDNIVNILGAASHTLIGLLTAEDKKKIDALYSLLGEQEDADTVVNTINEVLAIFSNYPEGVDIVSQLEKKVNYTDVINTLDSEETSKPLSAKMGKELKTEVDTKAELAYVNEELDKKALKSDILVIDEAVTAQESEITTTQNEGDKLVNEIVGYVDGSPKGVYASLSALQTAYPTGATGLYITKDNGHYYLWNGTSWEDCGVYGKNSNVVDIGSFTATIENYNNLFTLLYTCRLVFFYTEGYLDETNKVGKAGTYRAYYSGDEELYIEDAEHLYKYVYVSETEFRIEEVVSFKSLKDSITMINENEKRIENIEYALKGTTINTSEVSSVAYQVENPTNVLPYALINKVGGITYKVDSALQYNSPTKVISKSKNLFVLNDVGSTTINGVTYKIENGVITLNGTSTARVYTKIKDIKLNPGTYYIYDFVGNSNYYVYFNNQAIKYAHNKSVEITNYGTYSLTIYVESGMTLNNVILKPMLVIGSTAPTEFEQGTSEDYFNDKIIAIKNHLISLGYDSDILGYGVDSTYYNYIDFDNKKVVINCKRYSYESGDESNSSYITDNGFTIKPLTTIEEVDISSILDNDNYIKVEQGGSIVYENSNAKDIPSVATYQTKVS